jgi:hypothetical protein
MHTLSIVLVLLVEFLCPFLSNIVNVIEHNESVTSGFYTLPSSLKDMLLMCLHHLPRGEALLNHTFYPFHCFCS